MMSKPCQESRQERMPATTSALRGLDAQYSEEKKTVDHHAHFECMDASRNNDASTKAGSWSSCRQKPFYGQVCGDSTLYPSPVGKVSSAFLFGTSDSVKRVVQCW